MEAQSKCYRGHRRAFISVVLVWLYIPERRQDFAIHSTVSFTGKHCFILNCRFDFRLVGLQHILGGRLIGLSSKFQWMQRDGYFIDPQLQLWFVVTGPQHGKRGICNSKDEWFGFSYRITSRPCKGHLLVRWYPTDVAFLGKGKFGKTMDATVTFPSTKAVLLRIPRPIATFPSVPMGS